MLARGLAGRCSGFLRRRSRSNQATVTERRLGQASLPRASRGGAPLFSPIPQATGRLRARESPTKASSSATHLTRARGFGRVGISRQAQGWDRSLADATLEAECSATAIRVTRIGTAVPVHSCPVSEKCRPTSPGERGTSEPDWPVWIPCIRGSPSTKAWLCGGLVATGRPQCWRGSNPQPGPEAFKWSRIQRPKSRHPRN